MKFLVKTNTSFWAKIFYGKKTCIYQIKFEAIAFYKNGLYHNTKNASYIKYDGTKIFYLNYQYYGKEYKFTKQSWRRFCKLQTFL